MNKYWIPAFSLLLLAGCGIPAPRHSIPVVDAQGRPLYGSQQGAFRPQAQAPARAPAATPQPQPSPVQVIAQPSGSGLSVYSGSPVQPPQEAAPWGTGSSAPVGIYPSPAQGMPTAPAMPASTGMPTTPGGSLVPYPIIHQEGVATAPATSASAPVVAPASAPAMAASSLRSSNSSVQSLLQLASGQQASGQSDLAMANLERARLIAPNDPVVLYRLGEMNLARGNAQQAEQMGLNGINNAGSDGSLKAGLWDLVARARDQLGNRSGAEQARQNARVIQ